MSEAPVRLKTHHGPHRGAVTPDALARAVAEAAERDGFLVLERDDDLFLQYDGAHLELGGDGRIRRADLEGYVRGVFEAFLRGEDVASAAAWRDASDEVFRKIAADRRSRIGLLVMALVLIGGAAALWFLLANARGG